MKSHRMGFGQSGEDDEKVAFVFLPPRFCDSSRIWTEIIRGDRGVIINSQCNLWPRFTFRLSLDTIQMCILMENCQTLCFFFYK